MPGGAVVDRDRPYWPRLVTVADKRSGIILFSEAIDLETCRFSALGEGLLKAMEKRRLLPAEIQVGEEIVLKALQPLADSLKIRLKSFKTLLAIMKFKKAMTEHLGRRRS